MEEITFTLDNVLWILGFIAAMYAFYKMVKELNKPNEDLKKQVEENKKQLDINSKKIEHTEENYKIMMECLFAIINHEIDGNGIDRLKTMRDKLQKYLAN